jgi:hypothetical protein
MPRVTNQKYLDRHYQLQERWVKELVQFSDVPALEQRHLHEYYLPSKRVTDEQLLEHRTLITKSQPSLPQKAGKAYSLLMNGDVYRPTGGAVVTRGKLKGHRITVRPLIRPEPDLRKLAKALLEIAKDKRERQARKAM